MPALLHIILLKIINWILLLLFYFFDFIVILFYVIVVQLQLSAFSPHLSYFKLRNQGTQRLRNLPRVTHIVSGKTRIWTQEVCILPTTLLTILFVQSKVGFAKISMWLVIAFYLLPNDTMPALNTRLSNGYFQSTMNYQCWKYIYIYIFKTALL